MSRPIWTCHSLNPNTDSNSSLRILSSSLV